MAQKELEYLNKYDRCEKQNLILRAWVKAFAVAFIGAVLIASGLVVGSAFLIHAGLGTVGLGAIIPSLAWLARNYFVAVGRRY